MRDRLAVVAELLRMIWHHRAWILVPPVVALLVVSVLLFVVQVLPGSPFLYPLF